MNTEAVTIAHAMPGRIRLKIAGLKHHPALAADLQHRLAVVPAIQNVEINASTGSMIIRYDTAALSSDASLRTFTAAVATIFPDVDLSQIDMSSLVSANGTATAAPSVVAATLRSFFAQVNTNIDAATGGAADLRTLLPLLLFGLGVRSLFTTEKPLVPTWYDFLWFALGTYFMLNPKPGETPQ